MKQEIVQELERIRKAHGGILTGEAVLTAARRKDSPIHSEFEWDDSKAGHKHRLTQAYGLIRSFTVTVKEVNKEVRSFAISNRKVQGYIPLPDQDGYARIEDILKAGGEQATACLVEEWNRTNGHIERYIGFLLTAGHIEEAQSLEEAMRKVRASLESGRDGSEAER